MNLSNIRALFQENQLSAANIINCKRGWLLVVSTKSGRNIIMRKSRAYKGMYPKRVFSTIDTASIAAKEIGFDDIVVCLRSIKVTREGKVRKTERLANVR